MTPYALALLDVEPFVMAPGICLEGGRTEQVRCSNSATDAIKLFARLRALSEVSEPPIGPLHDRYRAIERVLPRLPQDHELD